MECSRGSGVRGLATQRYILFCLLLTLGKCCSWIEIGVLRSVGGVRPNSREVLERILVGRDLVRWEMVEGF